MTEVLFSLTDRPSFLDGLSRVMDISGSLNIYNSSHSEMEADLKALRSDWEAIGKDLGVAIESEEQRQCSEIAAE